MGRIITPEFRVSYPYVIVPSTRFSVDPVYSLNMLFDKATDISVIKEEMQRVIEERWPDKAKRPKALHNPLKDGDSDPAKEGVDGYVNTIFATAKTSTAPQVVGPNPSIIIKDEKELYAGCYARASLWISAFDVGGKKGIKFTLQNVQKIREGQEFSAKLSAADEFSNVENPSTKKLKSEFEDLLG